MKEKNMLFNKNFKCTISRDFTQINYGQNNMPRDFTESWNKIEIINMIY